MVVADHPFWTWSLEVYARPGVEKILLDLQDRLGLDANILLFACWTAASRFRPLSPSECRRLLADTADWRGNVIAPLRDVRRFLKEKESVGGIDSLREKVKLLELEAERIAQLRIAGMMEDTERPAAQTTDPADAALSGLEACLAAGGIVVSDRDRDLLSFLARACCE